MLAVVKADKHEPTVDEILSIRDKLFTDLTVEERELLDTTHPVMVLAVSASNGTMAKIIEVYLQTFDPVLVSEEACSTSLRNEAWRLLRRKSKGGFHCLKQLNSQLLATSRQQEVC